VSQPDRHVASHLSLLVHQPLRIILQVAVSGIAPAGLQESIRVCCDGVPIAVTEVTVRGNAAPPRVSDADRIAYLRPSRYAESDRLGAIAHAEFAGIDGAAELLAAVSSWVGSRLRYVPGSSGPTDGAVDTLLQRQGVCRDYAHLVIAMLRALDVPARLAAVYAPGLAPMDFHAVAEAAIGDQWRVVDATLLAPRAGLVRIATGRDAADTAFLSSYGGAVDLLEARVSAVVDGQLPADDVQSLVSIS